MKTINVVAAVLEKSGKYFIAKRPAGKQLGGLWEFPGGKVEPGETHQAALKREMLEEFDADIAVGELISAIDHEAEDRKIVLHFYRAYLLADRLTPLEHESTAWADTEEIAAYELAPADKEVIAFL